MHLPTEILHSIAEFAGTPNFKFLTAESPMEYDLLRKAETARCVQGLANLRLVNRAFCQATSNLLFRHVVATCDVSHTLSRLTRLHEMANSHYASSIRRLDLGIHVSASAENSLTYAEHLERMLPSTLSKLTNLRTLNITIRQGDFLSDATKAMVISAIAKSLGDANPQLLEKLTVSLPHASDYTHFFCSDDGEMPESAKAAFNRLRHMELSITNWRRVALRSFGNVASGADMFRLAQSAENLTTLALNGMSQVNLDMAAIPPSRNLQCLHLDSVSFSVETLRNLINSCRSSLKTIQFFGTELNAGNWRDALLEMSRLPRLQDAYLQSVHYSVKARSRDLPPYRLSMGETTVVRDDLDQLAVEILQRRVNDNRRAAGLAEIDEDRYPYDREQTLESALAALHAEEARSDGKMMGLSAGLVSFV